jgi:hypothetical protein
VGNGGFSQLLTVVAWHEVRCEVEKEGDGGGGCPALNNVPVGHGVTAGRWRPVVWGRGREALPGGPGRAACSSHAGLGRRGSMGLTCGPSLKLKIQI